MNNVEQFVIEHSDFELPKDELAHHGILGMKWGVQNGPPYPLDSEDHSTSEKKAGWKKSLDNGDNVKKKSPNVFEKIKAKKQQKKEEKEQALKKKINSERLAKARESKIAKQKQKEEHDNAIKKGDLDYIRQHKDEFSNNEINEALTRNQVESNLNRGIQSEAVKKAIATGDYKYAAEHRQEFTDNELNAVLGRYQLNTKLNELTKEKTAYEKVVSGINTAKKVAETTINGIETYNSIIKITNGLGLTNLDKINLNPEKPAISERYDVDENGVMTLTSHTEKTGNYTKSLTYKKKNDTSEQTAEKYVKGLSNEDFEEFLEKVNKKKV